MATKSQGTVVGVFADREDAREATHALREAGFSEKQIGVASSHASSGDDDDGTYEGEGAMSGAAAGTATGRRIGALWGLGILAGVLPAIGPAIAGGTLAALLSGAAAGAAAAGLAGALIGMGLSSEEAEYYEGEMQAGRTIVTVNADDRRDEAVRIMRQFRGYDMDSSAAHSSGATAPRAASDKSHERGDTIQAHEEKLNVKKMPVQTGEVRVRKETHLEHKKLDVPVTREEVVIERQPASGKAVSASDLGPGEEIRIPVREEQVRVEKETVVTDQVRVGKRQVKDTKHVDETLRKEEIKVEKEGNVNLNDQRP